MKMKKPLLIVAILVIVTVALVLVYVSRSRQLALKSAEVVARGEAMWEGAKPPSGLKGVLAIRPEEGIDAAIYAPTLNKVKPENLGAGELRIVVAKAETETPDLAEVRAKLAKAQERKGEDMTKVSEKPILLEVGGQRYPALEVSSTLKDSGRKLKENITILNDGTKTAVILITGPEESFNTRARDQFLRGLKKPDMSKILRKKKKPSPASDDAQPPQRGLLRRVPPPVRIQLR